MKPLEEREIELLMSAVRWEGRLMAVAISVVGIVGSSLLTWLASHNDSIIGKWWEGEDIDKAVAALVLFLAFMAVYLWQCFRTKKTSEKAQAILIDHGVLNMEVARLMGGDRRSFQVLTYGPIAILFGILLAVLT